MFYDLHKFGDGDNGFRYGTFRPTHVMIHDCVSDQVRACRELVRAGKHRPFQDYILEDGHWTGRSFSGWDELVRGVEQPWAEGLEMVERMTEKLRSVELPSPVVVKRTQRWCEEDGDLDLDRCMLGIEPYRGTVKAAGGGPQIVSMLVQINANANVSWEDMMWRAAACVAMASVLEEAGYTTEIQSFAYSVGAYTNYDNLLQSCWVKRAGDPLDMSSLVNATSAWFRRTVGFVGYNMAYDHSPHQIKTDEGYGSQAAAPDDILKYLAADPRSAWRIVEVWDEDSAACLARSYLETLSGGDRYGQDPAAPMIQPYRRRRRY